MDTLQIQINILYHTESTNASPSTHIDTHYLLIHSCPAPPLLTYTACPDTAATPPAKTNTPTYMGGGGGGADANAPAEAAAPDSIVAFIKKQPPFAACSFVSK